MSKQLVILVAAVIVVLAGVSVAGATLIPAALHRGDGGQSQTSTMNTASQNSFGNTTAFTDVTDSPVSLPSERTIQPPRTGNAGLLPAQSSHLVPAVALLNVMLALVVTARLATRAGAREG